jgi:hypothetical protein
MQCSQPSALNAKQEIAVSATLSIKHLEINRGNLAKCNALKNGVVKRLVYQVPQSFFQYWIE